MEKQKENIEEALLFVKSFVRHVSHQGNHDERKQKCEPRSRQKRRQEVIEGVDADRFRNHDRYFVNFVMSWRQQRNIEQILFDHVIWKADDVRFSVDEVIGGVRQDDVSAFASFLTRRTGILVDDVLQSPIEVVGDAEEHFGKSAAIAGDVGPENSDDVAGTFVVLPTVVVGLMVPGSAVSGDPRPETRSARYGFFHDFVHLGSRGICL